MLLLSRSIKLRILFGGLIVVILLYKINLTNDHGLYTLKHKPTGENTLKHKPTGQYTLKHKPTGQYTLKHKPTKAFNRIRPPVDCVRLIEGNETEQRRADAYQKDHSKKAITNEEYINMTRDCDRFVETRGYITWPSSEEETNFPLAFDILVFKDIELFERLLRAIYRPQNVYCVHVDKKADSTLHTAVGEIAGCFYNVFVLQNNIEVTWGYYSVLNAEILCMEALLKYKKWKYFINLTGQEFPLKTNWELVQILKVLNGSNIIGASIKRRNLDRFAGRPPPIDVTPTKGPVHIVARREFVEYAINNENGQKLLNWSKLVGVPDEMFFSTLNHNPQLGVPGSYLGEPEYHRLRYPFITRYKIWSDHNLPCHGKYVSAICILSVRDLPLLATTPHFIANKFHLDYQPLALDCLEELIFNRTQEVIGIRDFNTSYYQNLDVVKNHL